MAEHTGQDTGQDLERFVEAQDCDETYAAALGELRAGRKRTHWMWFVFPQVAGLGRSDTARRYALRGVGDAAAYLAHPVLGPRLVACTRALLDLGTGDAVEVLGPVDAQKLRSSMTLLAEAAPEETTFSEVLARFFGGERDPETLARL